MINLYTIGCPKCEILEEKLRDKNIKFNTITDVEKMKEKEIDILPVLEVDDELMEYGKAVRWVNNK